MGMFVLVLVLLLVCVCVCVCYYTSQETIHSQWTAHTRCIHCIFHVLLLRINRQLFIVVINNN
ncbi:MAG TPA: hypothetical protein V6C97_05790 [Oculatellaceae cyanobacterium]